MYVHELELWSFIRFGLFVGFLIFATCKYYANYEKNGKNASMVILMILVLIGFIVFFTGKQVNIRLSDKEIRTVQISKFEEQLVSRTSEGLRREVYLVGTDGNYYLVNKKIAKKIKSKNISSVEIMTLKKHGFRERYVNQSLVPYKKAYKINF